MHILSTQQQQYPDNQVMHISTPSTKKKKTFKNFTFVISTCGKVGKKGSLSRLIVRRVMNENSKLGWDVVFF
ncbi:MAG: hypothetical protein HLUCCA01_06195 [Bacteroidetes bacterium HLUCCA01]|nr:MAG: hypothetical protein HLUCCA01_06195 [Bacteroidetes bacterium HLUCCA01]